MLLHIFRIKKNRFFSISVELNAIQTQSGQ